MSAQGITLEIERPRDYQQAGLVEAAAAVTMRTRLGPGSQVLLRDGWDYQGSQGPFTVESRPRRKRYFLCKSGLSLVRVQYTAIDWIKTAEINGVTVPGPVLVNRIGHRLGADARVKRRRCHLYRLSQVSSTRGRTIGPSTQENPMGLTIHYCIEAGQDWTRRQIRQKLEDTRRFALSLPVVSVSEVAEFRGEDCQFDQDPDARANEKRTRSAGRRSRPRATSSRPGVRASPGGRPRRT